MRLLNAKNRKLQYFNNENNAPEYAILSHTWGDDEVTYRDIISLSKEQLRQKKAFQKIEKCCIKALEWGLEWVWMDTCCIDQTSSAELSEAINSMYQWYRQSAVCFAHLQGVTAVEKDFLQSIDADRAHLRRKRSFDEARWFNRGWCLQELLAPRNMHFYNTHWEYVGSKYSLKTHISKVTGIDEYGMFIPDLSVLSVAHRMSWAARRQTTRPEDVAYCLLGIFNINMPLLYGEGQTRAFYRLQEEIMRRTEDHSLFAWGGDGIDFRNDMVGFLAPHPSAFKYGIIDLKGLPRQVEPLSITGRGIRAELPLIRAERGDFVAVIGCCRSEISEGYYAVPVARLTKSSDVYRRTSSELQILSEVAVQNAKTSTLFLLRQSNPTHLEDKNTMQVWFSLLEMRDCIYRIKAALPESVWNPGRRVFAFSPSDFDGRPQMDVIFVNAKGDGFVLKMHLDLSKKLCFLDLTKYSEAKPKDHSHLDLTELRSWASMEEKIRHGSEDELALGSHTVRASVNRNFVYEQELYEVKVSIGY